MPSQILVYDPAEIARQLTLIDQQFLCEINLKELLKQSWLKKSKSPTLSKVAERAQSVALWVAYEILVTRPKYRCDVLAQFIRIGEVYFRCSITTNLNTIIGIGCPSKLSIINGNLSWFKSCSYF